MTDDFEKRFYDHIEEMREFRGEIRQYMKEQPARCANHSGRIEALAQRGKLVEQAIAFKEDDDDTIHARTQRVETVLDRAFFAFKALAWISSAAGAIYGGFSFLLKHTDKVDKVIK